MKNGDVYTITPKIKRYLIKRIGKEETNRLLHFMRMGNYIMLIGPSCTGKTTIRDILLSIGYPYVIDEAGLGRTIYCGNKISGDLKPRSDIFSELGIEKIHQNADIDHSREWMSCTQYINDCYKAGKKED